LNSVRHRSGTSTGIGPARNDNREIERLNLHEYQAKALFADHGLSIPLGRYVTGAEQARSAAGEIGGDAWVVKAQVHAGGRGKAGGIRFCDNHDAVRDAAYALLGSRLVTHQSGADGLPIAGVLIEQATHIERELYLAALVDRRARRVAIMASASGGMDIETVARETPEKLLVTHVDPGVGLMPWQWRKLGYGLDLDKAGVADLGKMMRGLLRLLEDADASLVEINPLVVTAGGGLLALDAKVNLDDSALYRHEDLAALRDPSQEDPRELAAAKHQLNYIALDGDIGCMVNGAGLAMATMDLVQLHGGRPANFLDVGGGTSTERVAEAFKLILSDGRVRAVLVNIFGGIVRCDLIAEGIIAAAEQVALSVPLVVRLEGTRAAEGLALLSESGLALETASGLDEAAGMVVAMARRPVGS
jgi:succinyl-CoA synthetase beta subunit